MIYIGSPYRVFHYNGGIIDRYKRLANDYLLDKDLIQFNNNDIIIDIGANVGELGLYFKKIINVKIQYHAFEPGLEEYYANQCNNFTDNDYINNLALGDETGTIKLYNKNKSGDSSIFPIKNYESISQVNILTLDEYINQNGITTIKLIKLEAEGAEPEIIRGAIKSLEITQYITADLGYERGILQEETFSNCTNFLIRNNFLLIGININQSRLVGLFEKEKK